jgi:hypothetical protein
MFHQHVCASGDQVTEPDKTGLKSADLAILGGENITPAAQQARGQELVTKGRAIESRNQSLLDVRVAGQ